MSLSDFEPECEIKLTLRSGEVLEFKGEYKGLPECFEIGIPGLKIKYFPWAVIEKVEVQLSP